MFEDADSHGCMCNNVLYSHYPPGDINIGLLYGTLKFFRISRQRRAKLHLCGLQYFISGFRLNGLHGVLMGGA